MIISKKILPITQALYAKNTVYNSHRLKSGQMQQFSCTGTRTLCSSVLKMSSLFHKGEQKYFLAEYMHGKRYKNPTGATGLRHLMQKGPQ